MKTASRILAFTILALALVYAPAAKAETFTLTGTGDGVNFSLTGSFGSSGLSDGSVLITGITGGILNSILPDLAGGSISFYGITAAPGAASLSPSGQFTYDNLLYLAGNPILDASNGILFLVGSTEINIASIGGGLYDLWYKTPGGYGTVTLSGLALTNVTPEPVTLILFGTGLAGIGGVVRRKLATSLNR